MSVLDLILATATILGGIAAIWFFWDKIIAWWRPNREAAADPAIIEKWVDLTYPTDSGLQANLEAAGYRLTWCLDTRLARRIDLEGWEVVTEPDGTGALVKFKVQDHPADQTLIKRRADDTQP